MEKSEKIKDVTDRQKQRKQTPKNNVHMEERKQPNLIGSNRLRQIDSLNKSCQKGQAGSISGKHRSSSKGNQKHVDEKGSRCSKKEIWKEEIFVDQEFLGRPEGHMMNHSSFLSEKALGDQIGDVRFSRKGFQFEQDLGDSSENQLIFDASKDLGGDPRKSGGCSKFQL